ncbi:hypothetical protein ACFYW6_38015 [Streptomyces sp. NPDC002659]|uniref:hypothetical protein n=1 Tax=Streptomyces sp. NPDC002659 TaxID=3364656 RepID=UPI0036A1F15E
MEEVGGDAFGVGAGGGEQLGGVVVCGGVVGLVDGVVDGGERVDESQARSGAVRFGVQDLQSFQGG